jgi:hypothetical protein
VKKPRNVLIVIPDPKFAVDHVADHRAGPHPSLIAGSLRPRFDDANQLLELLETESRSRARSLSVEQTLQALDIVPTEPPVNGCTDHIELTAHRDYALSINVPEHSLAASPQRELSAAFSPVQKDTELLASGRRTKFRSDCLALLGHDLSSQEIGPR